MPPKKSTDIVTQPTQEISTVLYDEVFELSDGRSIRMIVDMATILTKVQEYTQALTDARGLPFDLDNLSARDPIIRYLVAKHDGQIKEKKMSDGQLITLARNYYQRALAEAQSNAHLLAFFDSDNNVFDTDPTPYEPVVEKSARFIEPMPVVEKNLAFSIERTLKQILDMLTSNPSIIGRVMSISDELSVRVNRVVSAGGLVETDESGFQSGSVNGTVS